MAIIPGILETVGIIDTPTGTPFTDTDGFFVNAPDFGDDTQSVSTGRGTDRRIGFRQTIDLELYKYDQYAQLNTWQLAGTTIDVRFTFSGPTVFTYSPVLFTAVPLLGQLDDEAKVHVAASGTSGDPTGGGTWYDLGLIRQGSSADVQANSDADGLGRPIYVTTSVEWTVELADPVAASTDLANFAGQTIKFAVEHADGTFVMLDEMDWFGIIQPNIGLDVVVSRALTVSGSARDFTSILTVPASPPDYFYGVAINGIAAGQAEGDVLTIT